MCNATALSSSKLHNDPLKDRPAFLSSSPWKGKENYNCPIAANESLTSVLAPVGEVIGKNSNFFDQSPRDYVWAATCRSLRLRSKRAQRETCSNHFPQLESCGRQQITDFVSVRS